MLAPEDYCFSFPVIGPQLTILRSQNVLITFHFGYENVLILRFKNVKT